jgi:hypothetical protein
MTISTILATIGVSLFSGNALAEQTKKEKSNDYTYIFTDETLVGDDLKGQVDVIKVPQRGMRDRLIRPRMQFVTELLKSVEAL